MGFRQDAYAKVWNVENKGNYSVVELSTSKKNRQTDQYETDFSNKFVRFIGSAHSQVQGLIKGSSIKIGSCEVTNRYVKDKNETYINYLVYSFDSLKPKKSISNIQSSLALEDTITTEDSSDLPFN
jgi:hypothetical protein